VCIMAITCPHCGAEFDASLFEYEHCVRCICGAEIRYPGSDLRSGHVAAGPYPVPLFCNAKNENPLGKETRIMDTLSAIHTRRSIRKYLDQPVSEDRIEKLLAAAMQAPSARNEQLWQFVVIDNRATLAQIPEFMPNAPMAAHAPLAILICGDMQLEKTQGYWVVDCSAATENMLLAAHALGLGACWCGVYPRQERMEGLQKLLGLPKNVVAHSLVVVGHPNEKIEPENHYQPDRVHRNRWK
jgi:nitroreductase